MTQKQLDTSKFQAKREIQREIKKNLCWFTVKIRNYYFWLFFVARKNFLQFDTLLAGMITKVYPFKQNHMGTKEAAP